MSAQYSTQINMNALEKTVHELINLNVKTIQNMTYVKPIGLLNTQKPELSLEKNVQLMIDNGHKALEYMQSVFDIMEKNWLNVSRQTLRQSQETMEQTEKTARSAINKGIKATGRATKSATSPLKSNTNQPTRSASSTTTAKTNKIKTAPSKKSRTASSTPGRQAKATSGTSSISVTTRREPMPNLPEIKTSKSSDEANKH